MTVAWTLELEEPTSHAARIVGGLPVALRLALDAQRAGAAAVVSPSALEPLLRDARLRIPVMASLPAGTASVCVPASLVAHRDAFGAAVASLAPGEGIALTSGDPPSGDRWGFRPVVVIDDASARLAERCLLRSLRKPQDGWTSRWLNRHVSLALTRWLVRTPLHPNQVSVGILLVGLTGAYLAAQGTYGAQLAGAALFQAQSILDGCDGEMSRITHRGSHAGEWLDTIGDDLTNYGFFAGAAWGLYGRTGSLLYLGAGAVTIACGLVASGLEYRYLVRIGSGDLLKHPASQTSESGGALGAVAPLFKRDTFVLLTLLAALLDGLGPMLVVFAAGSVGVLANVLSVELRLRREVSS
jgi:phosphatidylglycerophosphate synthase